MNNVATHLSHILIRQHVTEKGTRLAQLDQYLFKVHLKATKKEIKQAIETGFNVKVAAVNTVKLNGKTRRFGKNVGRKSNWKKAYITLVKGHTINLSDSEQVKD